MEQTATGYTRRGALLLGAAALASAGLRGLFPDPPGDDPNDFPVGNHRPLTGSVGLSLWRLRVVGAVASPLALSYRDLLSLPRRRHRYPLTCVGGWSATRDWEGVTISQLLDLARPLLPNPAVRPASVDGHSLLLEPARYLGDGALVVTHVAGLALSDDHGFPARLMLPDVQGLDNVKWLAEIQVLEPSSAGA